MPKVVDNYVLERKIGKGQYGDVFKGYNKLDNRDVAIKAIRRAQVKGKLSELLDNEIRAMKTCQNDNIVRLYDIKKTSNNFYLMVEYCNEGDCETYCKDKVFLPEDEAVDILLQVFNAFQELVKHQIMHRDFKLANLLRHDGRIKLADFGFAKLLTEQDFATTILGSPLNMAPEVLNGDPYTNKADVWSVGTVLFEMLFGRPPWNAENVFKLLQAIKGTALTFPANVQKISPIVQDLLKRMLVVDPKTRISWDELFKHPIKDYLNAKVKEEFSKTMSEALSLPLMVNRIYVNNNRVIQHPGDIRQKQQVNEHAIALASGKDAQESVENVPAITGAVAVIEEEKLSRKEIEGPQDDEVPTEETEWEKQIRSKKQNSTRVLHDRNIYVFLAIVAEEAAKQDDISTGLTCSFLLVKQLLQNHMNLAAILNSNDNTICEYITKEKEVFKRSLQARLEKLQATPAAQSLNENVKKQLNDTIDASVTPVLKQMLKTYCASLLQKIEGLQGSETEAKRPLWTHLSMACDAVGFDRIFPFINPKDGKQFDFNKYYALEENQVLTDLITRVKGKAKDLAGTSKGADVITKDADKKAKDSEANAKAQAAKK